MVNGEDDDLGLSNVVTDPEAEKAKDLQQKVENLAATAVLNYGSDNILALYETAIELVKEPSTRDEGISRLEKIATLAQTAGRQEPMALLRLGQAYYLKEDYAKAASYFDQFRTLVSVLKDIDALEDMAKVYAETKQLKKQILVTEMILPLKKEQKETYGTWFMVDLALLYSADGNNARAEGLIKEWEQEYNALHRDDNGNSSECFDAAKHYVRVDNNDEAARLAAKGCKALKEDVLAGFDAAISPQAAAYEGRGMQRSKAYLQLSLDKMAAVRLGIISEELGLADKAKAYYAKALSFGVMQDVIDAEREYNGLTKQAVEAK